VLGLVVKDLIHLVIVADNGRVHQNLRMRLRVEFASFVSWISEV
jgi:hypothetical protein